MHIKSFCCILLFISIAIAVSSSTAAEPNLKEIMQGLRDDVVEITDGLLTDDLTRVARGAVRIANHPRIPAEQVQLVAAELGTEMASFKQFDNSVHELSFSIAAAADKKDRKSAIANYEHLLASCLACHAAYKERIATVLGGVARP